MDTSAPSREPKMDNSLIKTTEKAPLNQVLSLKASSILRVTQMMRKNCITALRFMCLPAGFPMCDKVVCCSAQPQLPMKDKTEEEALHIDSPRSTVLIVNISNSTLNGCVIGNNPSQVTVTDRQPLMQHSDHFVHGERTCSCGHGQQEATQVSSDCPPSSEAEQLSINIQHSNLNYVMIGDNSSMYAEQGEPFE